MVRSLELPGILSHSSSKISMFGWNFVREVVMLGKEKFFISIHLSMGLKHYQVSSCFLFLTKVPILGEEQARVLIPPDDVVEDLMADITCRHLLSYSILGDAISSLSFQYVTQKKTSSHF